MPNVLRGVETIDMSVTVMGQKLAMPVYCSPTALQRLFHHQGERAVAAAAAKYGTMFGVSSLGTVSLEELRKAHDTPQVYQFYFHRDRGLNRAMMQRAKEAGVEVMMLTVDSITGGNRERDLRTGFSIPFRLTLGGMLQFAIKPAWGINYLTHERLQTAPAGPTHRHERRGGVDRQVFHRDAGPFHELGRRGRNGSAVERPVLPEGHHVGGGCETRGQIGCTGIVLSNHGGRQLDGSRAAFDQLAEIVDAVGDRIDVMMDGGIQRGTHVLEGAFARGQGRWSRALLSLSSRGGRPGRRRAGPWPDAGGDRAGNETDGLHRDRPALA